ncbi:hypothetical protein [Gilliamella sp. ESL0250]
MQFCRHNIDVFKEISLNKINYPYVKQMYIIEYAIRVYNTDSVKQWDNHN